MGIETEMRHSAITQTAGGLLGSESLVLRYGLRKSTKVIFLTVAGLMENRSWNMHLWRGDSAALSVAENVLSEKCQKE